MKTPFPLHPAQQDVYTDQLIDVERPHYNIGGYIILKGVLNQLKFYETIYSGAEVFDAFRMRFDINGERFEGYEDNDYQVMEIAGLDFSDRTPDEVIAWMRGRFNTAFEINTNKPLFEQYLIKIEEDEHWFFGRYHHLITDGYGFIVWVNYLASKYKSLVEGTIVEFAYPSYREAAAESFNYKNSPAYAVEGDYWMGKLIEKPRQMLQKKYAGATQPLVKSSTFQLDLSPEQRLLIDTLQEVTKVGIQQLTIAALLIYFGKTSGQSEFLFGIPVHKRGSRKLRNIVGMFSGILPHKSSYHPDIILLDLLKDIAASQKRDYRHQNYLNGDLTRALKIPATEGYLCEVLINYEPLHFDLNFGEAIEASIIRLANEADRNPLQICWRDYAVEHALQLQIHYSTAFFTGEEIDLLAKRVLFILQQFSEGLHQPIGSFEILPPAEHQLLSRFTNTHAAYPGNLTIVDLFEKQVMRTPEKTAVVYENQQLSYYNLNLKVNRLAHYLQSRGVKANMLVPICMERSADMIVGILGILKAGGAYVPIDPEYPSNRIEYILNDTNAAIVVSSKKGSLQLPSWDTFEMVLPDAALAENSTQHDENPEARIEPHSLAYVIYTSGSTGLPKGVLIEHLNVVRLFKTDTPLFDFNDQDVWSLFHSFSFDFSVWEMYGALLYGGRLVIVPADATKDVVLFRSLLAKEGVTVLNQTPSAFYNLQQCLTENPLPLSVRYIIFGGEALTPAKLEPWKQLYPDCRLINMYGITETTVHVTYQEIGWQQIGSATSIIGKPIPTLSIYIVDKDQKFVPVGIDGEIYVGGAGLARGYLNQPQLTAERFIPDPFSQEPGARLYKTGDLGRWLPDGNIVYAGRMDEQVKIRGYRIELGEVETVLEQSGLVKAAVVMAREDGSGNKRLVGYVVVDKVIDKKVLITYLKDKLPEYMVPALWVQLDALPLTPNGKTDRKALPDVDMSEQVSHQYRAPANKAEADIAAVWQEFLNVERVGTADNFFELGGDSIIAIQVISRLKRMGYSLQPKDIFIHQTINNVSAILKSDSDTATTAEQELLTGAAGLLPIQQQYLNKDQPAVSHYNQSVLLKVEKSIPLSLLQQAIAELTNHHDALRFTYFQINGAWQQEYGLKKAVIIEEDLRFTPDYLLGAAVSERAGIYQRSLNIGTGDIFRAVWMQTPAGEKENRLLIIIHHLAVDVVSWRILIEDLQYVLNAILTGGNISLGSKSSSYRQWYSALENYGQSKRLLSQLKYWEGVVKSYSPLPVDTETADVIRIKDTSLVRIKLNATETNRLLAEVPRVYHTEINDILLTALAYTLCGWSKGGKVVIGLEGHGREPINNETYTSRTVGWFTSLYPVVLAAGAGMDAGDGIIAIKEQLRRIPDKGLGYGVLKYLVKESSLQGQEPWDIVFNYLGQLNNVAKEGGWLSVSDEAAGDSVGNEQVVQAKLSVDSYIQTGELEFTWRYSHLHYSKETVNAIAIDYLANLQLLINHCVEKGENNSTFTPSDYGLHAEISHSELQPFLEEADDGKKRKDKIEGIYRLSSLQQGMLFHGLYDGGKEAYMEQFSCDIVGVDSDLFKKSWNDLLRQHSVLRSAFYHQVFSIPVQCVYRDVEIGVELIDYRNLSPDEQKAALKAYEDADLKTGFNFKTPPLMRLGLIRLSDDRYRMIWTSHHILFDGWSLALLMEEFLRTYEQAVSGKKLQDREEDRYEDYIRYLERVDYEPAEKYWRTYLQNIEQPTLLPFINAITGRIKGIGEYGSVFLQMDAATTIRLQQYVQQHRITVNTVMQGVWAYLLHSYTGNPDIVFGAIVSGRTNAIPDIENRVGMFINTLPLHAHLPAEEAIADWLQHIQIDQVSSRQYQHLPLQNIQALTRVQGDLFDSLLVFENYPVSKILLSGEWSLQFEKVQLRDQNNFPLTVTIGITEEVTIDFRYNTSLLQAAYVQKIKAHFEHVLLQIIQQQIVQLKDIELLTAGDKQQLLQEFNNTTVTARGNKNVVELFEEQVIKNPGSLALVFEESAISFCELNERANRLAHYLISTGVTNNTLVPVCVESSIEMVVAIWGILKAGGAYAPIDPTFPPERIKYILNDCSANMVLSNKQSISIVDAIDRIKVIDLDDQILFANQPASNPEIAIETDNLAYIIYTSGSTGYPKGVMVQHQNLAHYICNSKTEYVSADKKSAGSFMHLSYTFDASLTALFMPLLKGKSIVIGSKDSIDVFEDANLWKYAPYDFIKLTPVHLELLQPKMELPDGTLLTDTLVVGGEALLLSHVADLLNKELNVSVINEYGPTEATVGCSTYTFNTAEKNESLQNGIPIGKPIDNTELYIVNEANALVAIGVAGEICIGGAGVVKGYLNKPDLTAKKFVSNPFRETGAGTMYKTGDIGRWLPDGNMEYLGRKDDQVKIRGYRIELGEIESVLQQCEWVKQAVVLAIGDTAENKRLVAYIVPEGYFDKAEILEYVSSRLPDYMIPSVLKELETLPLTPNGKIDRKALAATEMEDVSADEFIAARNETEEKLTRIWQQLLEIDQVGVYDDFFELGGHSLLAVKMIAAIRKEFGVELGINEIFDYPTIAMMAAKLQSGLQAEVQPVVSGIGIQKRPVYIPLSFSQERLWFIHQLEGSLQYHVPAILRLHGKLNKEALHQSLQAIINRHEVLRTVIWQKDGQGYQFVLGKGKWQMEEVDSNTFENKELALQQYINGLIKKPFDLSNDHLIRATLITLNESEYRLVVVMHHIASDAWSMPVLVQEFMELYGAYNDGRPAQLAPMQLQYADYAIWQRNYLHDDVLNAKLAYWKEKLNGVSPLQLPADYNRPAVSSTRGASASFHISPDLKTTLSQVSQQNGTTLYMTLLAAFNVLLYRYSGQEDICVGTSIAGRPQRELEDLIGFFVNTLALRNEVNGEMKFSKLLGQVRTTMLEAYAHQEVPFEKVVEAVVKDRDPGRSPLFQVMLVLRNTPDVPDLQLGDLIVTPEPYEFTTVKFDLTFFLTESQSGLEGSVLYSTDLFSKGRIERMIAHFMMLLNSVVADINNKVGTLQMLSEAEENQSKQGFNVSKISEMEDVTVIAMFEKQAVRWPQSAALNFEGEEVSYGELNERANQLAHYLHNCGVKQDSLVPLFIERGPDMITGILGILKAGGAYVPIDTGLPIDRISFMLQDTGATVVVCSEESREKLSAFKIDTIEIEGPVLNNHPKQNLNSGLTAHNLAYVIYTSGSTGQPKGVMVTHGNLTDYVQGLDERTGINSCNSFALVSTIATDLGNTVLFPSLISGGTLHLFSREAVSNIEYLHEYFGENDIDCVKIVPSHWKALMMDGKPLLPRRLLVFGGESLQAEQVAVIKNSKRRKCRVVNHYGPTETTVGKLLYEVDFRKEYTGTMPIGKPFGDSRIFVLNNDLSLCPAGVPGQLYIGGTGVARGYLNNEQLTREKFIADPFDAAANSLLYKTGDLVKYDDDGNIMFLGRIDDQVKIRGYRVEPGEVERILSQSGQVSQAVVVAADDKQGNKRLVAYVVAKDFDREALNIYLKEKLPDYMIPSVIVTLDSLPLTTNGKVDRKKLPDPESVVVKKDESEITATETEMKLAEIWKDVLELDNVGLHDDFFELGGHSLLAVRLVSAIRKAFSVEMPIGHVFDYPTVSLLSAQLPATESSITLPVVEVINPRPDHVPLSFSQERLWFIDRLEGSIQYHVPAVLQLKGTLNKTALSKSLQEIIHRHQALRTVIINENGTPYQYLQEADTWKIEIIDDTPYLSDIAGMQRLVEELISKPFDLSKDFMLRAHLICLAADKNVLIVTLHHIASDGWSRSVLVKELVELYQAIEEGRSADLKVLPVQYADYSLWQRKYLQGEILENKLLYWKHKLDGVASLEMPTDYVRPAVWSTRGAVQNFTIDKTLTAKLESLSRQHGATLFMVVLSAFKVLLHRYSQQEDICVGTPVAGRQQHDLEGLIGFFVNTLAIRSSVDSDLSFVELLQQVRTTTLEAFGHQEIPFEKVVDAVVKERDLSRNPLFQVMFVLRNTPEVPELRLGEVQLSVKAHGHTTAMFDIQVFLTETPQGLEGMLEYNTDLFKAETIARLLDHYTMLLTAVVATPTEKIGWLPMLTGAEKRQLLTEFNDTAADYPTKKTVIDLFEEQVIKTPEAVATVFEKQQLTYAALNEHANQLAHLLRSKGVQQEVLVPVCLDRSLEMIVAILGILKAGGAYVPIDPAYPAERIQYMLNDVSATIVLSTTQSSSKLPGTAALEIIELDRKPPEIEQQPSANLNDRTNPEGLAYVIYTSGSTGKPKGVMNQHDGLVNRLLWAQSYYGLTSADSVLQKTTFCFDVSVWELLWPLIAGARLVIARPEGHRDNVYLKHIISKEKITLLHFVPSMLSVFLSDVQPGECDGLKKVLCSGEALSPSQTVLFKQKLPHAELHNLYGPTEAAIDVTYWSLPQAADISLIPIGKPVANTHIYIIDPFNQPVPVGVAGEICIGGIQVARGYLNQAALTAEKFVADPFSQKAEAKMYRTGDLGKWLANGNIAYLGRMDTQVKVRGFRIELSEVEAALNELEYVNTNCVVAKADIVSSNKLVAYYVPDTAAVKAKEAALYQEQVAAWKEVYENEYEQPENGNAELDDEFNIVSWNDSFTGLAIEPEQMQDWVQDIVKVILSEDAGTVLEIGCGTGLIYYRLAGKVKKYTGTDFSAMSVGQIRRHISKGIKDYGPTELQVCAAHEVTLGADEKVDTIILNSVAQYFPGEAYMNEVIGRSINHLKGRGRIIIGDVRDKRTLGLFKSRLQLQKLQGTLGIREFNWTVEQEVQKEEELCFSPEYFYALQSAHPQITQIDIQWKQSSYSNEMSLYRYTVVLYVGIERDYLKPDWQSWRSGDQQDIINGFSRGNAVIAIKNAPNPRLWKERQLSEALQSNLVNTVGELSEAIAQPKDEQKRIADIFEAGILKGYRYRLFLHENPLLVNILFELAPSQSFVLNPYTEKAHHQNDSFTNIPLFGSIVSLMQREIRMLLGEKLPEYMVPSELVALSKLPLTTNGKADRLFLSQREDKGVIGKLNYQPPTTGLQQQLCAIWQSLLGVERVGISDNFFELGGHSLLGMRLISAMRKQMGIELSIKDLFLYPTIASLAAYVSLQHTGVLLPPVEVYARPERIPLSFSQERLWFIDKLEGSVQYHMPAVIRLSGNLQVAVLQQALQNIVIRHEVLRTVIRENEGQGYQHVLPAAMPELIVVHDFIDNTNDETLQAYINVLIRKPFNLANDYLIRAALIVLNQQEHLLVVTMHHIASDAWSMSILVKELVENYRSLSERRMAILPDVAVQYADYAIWQRKFLQGEVLEKKLSYWEKKLQHVAPLQLPADYVRPAQWSSHGAGCAFKVDYSLLTALESLSHQHGCTLFMTLQAIFKILLQRYSGQTDICIGTPTGNRPQQELEALIGFFVNTLALRSNVSDDISFTAFLQQVKTTTLDAFEHQDIPFEKVVDVLVKERDLSRNPLYQVLFSMQNAPDSPALQLKNIALAIENVAHNTSKLDMTFTFTASASGLEGWVEYATDLFSEHTILRMIAHFKELIKSVLANPDSTIGDLPMISAAEKHQLLAAFNDTAIPYPKDKTIIHYFEEQAAVAGDATALVFGAQTMTYSELNERSNQVARYLISKGVGKETLVPVFLLRSFDMVIGILGILKAGAAYVPIDTNYPPDRINYMLDDIGGHLIVTSSHISQRIVFDDIDIIEIDEEWPYMQMLPGQNLQTVIEPHTLAYIIYTSGSTGKPKGVMIEHHSLLNYLLTSRENYINDNAGGSGSFMHLSYTFDASVTALYLPLLAGKAAIINSGNAMEAFDDINLQKSAPFDFIKITPGHLGLLPPVMKKADGTQVTQKLVIGGEALRQGQFNLLYENGIDVKVINEYGPTEATVGCSTYTFNLQKDYEKLKNGIPIGKPMSNVQLYILNNRNALVPVGVIGEICIGGPGIARGYLNNPGLSAEKFIAHPFSNEAGATIYKSGDVGRWLADGNIEYIGRKDDQVKIRGYRVELGEVESTLAQHATVKQCIVLASHDKQGRHRLVAYVVPVATFDKENLVAYLKEKLPDYMMPAVWVEMDSLPLNANGKIDKKALPGPDVTEAPSNELIAPYTRLEEQLIQIWQDLLETETVGINNNFFELGGDSILAIQMVSRARITGYEIKVADVFTYQTIARLSLMLEHGTHNAATVNGEQDVLTGPAGLLPIQQWYFQKERPDISHFNQSVLLKISKAITSIELNSAVELLIAHHDALRFIYYRQHDQWHQEYGRNSGAVITEDLQGDNSKLSALITERSEKYQRSLNITKGELVRAVLMQTPAAEPENRLLIVIHHLAVDGVSWRILLSDLELLLNKGMPGNKTSSYRQWYNALLSYGQSQALMAQKNYWEQVVQSYSPLFTDFEFAGEVHVKDTGLLTVRLGIKQTQALLQEVPRVYHTEINDILLAALAVTLCSRSEKEKIVIGLEGHGREHISDEIDTTRTVGWFTNIYPVLLEGATNNGTDGLIKGVKEQLRQVPGKGLGYGVLKYINKEEALQGTEHWDIVFNYLGQLDNVMDESGRFAIAGEYNGSGRSGEQLVSEKLSVNGYVRAGELIFNWSFSAKHYRESTIAKMAADYLNHLQLLINHCLNQGKKGAVYTPSDYGLGKEVTFEELDEFLEEKSDNILSF